MIVTSDSKLIALIGHPVSHTRSHILFSYFEEEFESNCVYMPFDVEPDNLVAAIKGLKAMGFRGANITAPYKTEVFQKARSIGMKLTEVARVCQSVNCLYYDDAGQLWGTTTDYVAFCDMFRNSIPNAVDLSSVLIIGSGGVSKVVLQAVWDSTFFCKVDFLCRDTAKCSDFVQPMYEKYTKAKRRGFVTIPSPQPDVYSLNDLHVTRLINLVHQYDVIINATPVGMFPNTQASPLPEDVMLAFGRNDCGTKQTIIDLIYNPPVTRLLQSAADHGCKCVNGRLMLVDQFVESYRLWIPKTVSGCSKEELVKIGMRKLGWAE